MSLWSSRNLTLMGQITVMKSLIITRMIYRARLLPLIIQKTFIAKTNFWGSNWERVSRHVLCNDIKSAGAKMMHLESCLTALHAKNLLLFLMKLVVHNGSLLKIYSSIVIC